MDMIRLQRRIADIQAKQIEALGVIINQQNLILRALEPRRHPMMTTLHAFLGATWRAFSRRLATNLGQWLAGLPLWLLVLEVSGLRRLLAEVLGLSM